MEIKNTISEEDIEWEFDNGELVFEKEIALAHLLINEVVYTNSFWWMYEDFRTNPDTKKLETVPLKDARWTKEESRYIAIFVNCNDIFYWACSDAELLPHHQIKTLYEMWKADPEWGPAKWCCIQRNKKPQEPVIKLMKELGVWDSVMEGLGVSNVPQF